MSTDHNFWRERKAEASVPIAPRFSVGRCTHRAIADPLFFRSIIILRLFVFLPQLLHMCTPAHSSLFPFFFLPFCSLLDCFRTVLNSGISIHVYSSRFNGLSSAATFQRNFISHEATRPRRTVHSGLTHSHIMCIAIALPQLVSSKN